MVRIPSPSSVHVRLSPHVPEGNKTVTVQVAVAPLPSAAVAVIVAVPAFWPSTLPSLSTVATLSSLLVQIMDLTVASEGVIVAVSCKESPENHVSTMLAEVWSKAIPVT